MPFVSHVVDATDDKVLPVVVIVPDVYFNVPALKATLPDIVIDPARENVPVIEKPEVPVHDPPVNVKFPEPEQAAFSVNPVTVNTSAVVLFNVVVPAIVRPPDTFQSPTSVFVDVVLKVMFPGNVFPLLVIVLVALIVNVPAALELFVHVCSGLSVKFPATTIVKFELIVIVAVYPAEKIKVNALAVAPTVQLVLPNVPAPSNLTSSDDVGESCPVVPPDVVAQSVDAYVPPPD